MENILINSEPILLNFYIPCNNFVILNGESFYQFRKITFLRFNKLNAEIKNYIHNNDAPSDVESLWFIQMHLKSVILIGV